MSLCLRRGLFVEVFNALIAVLRWFWGDADVFVSCVDTEWTRVLNEASRQ